MCRSRRAQRFTCSGSTTRVGPVVLPSDEPDFVAAVEQRIGAVPGRRFGSRPWRSGCDDADPVGSAAGTNRPTGGTEVACPRRDAPILPAPSEARTTVGIGGRTRLRQGSRAVTAPLTVVRTRQGGRESGRGRAVGGVTRGSGHPRPFQGRSNGVTDRREAQATSADSVELADLSLHVGPPRVGFGRGAGRRHTGRRLR